MPIMICIFLVALTTGVIVWFLPDKQGIEYTFEINKPWTSGTLISEFRFPIIKSDEAMEREKKALLKNYQPYFTKDTRISERAIEEFNIAVAKDTTRLLARYQEPIVRRLHSLYDKGIMSDHDQRRCLLEMSDSIRILNGKYAITECINDLQTTRSSYDMLFFDEELSSHREELTKFNFNEYLHANLSYDYGHNRMSTDELYSDIAPSVGVVEANEKIIDQGEMVDSLTELKIKSYMAEKKKRQSDLNQHRKDMMQLGQILFTGIFVLLFTIYLLIYRHDFFQKPRKLLMLYFMIMAFPIMVSLLTGHSLLSVYIIPFAIVPMITRVFLDSRTAFMVHTTIVLISAIAVNYQYEFIIIEMVAGMAAIFTLGDMSKRSHLFLAALIATISAIAIHLAINLFQKGEMPQKNDMIAYLVTSGVLLLLAYPLMYIIEKLFGFISQVTYYELSDTNQTLLRMLSEKAPGTFAHSTTVSNLAAEIAKRIGADVMLVRTGALYHDIGKMENPAFFTENQAGFNPHDKISEKESAKVIISHVTYGQRLAENYHLPDIIKDFILTHHGKGITSFFYIKYKNAHPDEEVDISDFSYPGPNPQTKEQAILMMADTVEAATKALDEYNDENISKRVNELIDKQVNDGYFRECPITFRDIAMAKPVLIERLKSIYHTRIKYPELKTKENDEELQSSNSDNTDNLGFWGNLD